MKPLELSDYVLAANLLDCEVAAIRAVAEVESSGSGFLRDGRPRIKYEGHVFHRLTKGKYDKEAPTLSYPKWTEKHTQNGLGEWDRLAEAIKLDRNAALMSASWGKFQILGENFVAAGYRSVQGFVTGMYKGEKEHLLAFVSIVKSFGLTDELQRHDWAVFARIYNGPGYKKNAYDTKMARYYSMYAA